MADPVKIVLQRRPRPGKTEVFQAWARELVQSAASLAVVEGSSVLAAEGGSHFILLRFANQAELGRWQSDPAARALLARGDELAEEPGSPVIHEGLETWFALPGHAAEAPAAWKMALVTWLCLLPQVLVLGAIVPSNLPYPLAPIIGTAIPVAMLAWLMPRLTPLLRRWLYPRTHLDRKE